MRGAIINERNSRAVSMGIAVGRQHGLSTLDALNGRALAEPAPRTTR